MQSQPLIKALQSNDPSWLQNYIHNCIPNDPENLERIHQQLQKYHTVPKQMKYQPKSKTGKLPTQKSVPVISSRDSPSQKSLKLMQDLRDKGINLTERDSISGFKVYEYNKTKLVRPLQQNPKMIANRASSMRSLINRYNINQRYYNKQDNNQKQLDQEMKNFLQYRTKLLSNIQMRHNQEPNVKYKNIQCKFDCPENQNYSTKQQYYPKSALKNKIRISADNVLQKCQKQLSFRDKYLQNQLNKNIFLKLSNKMAKNPNLSDSMDDYVFDSLGNNSTYVPLADEQYNRYTHTYLKMMNVIDETKKHRLNHHKRDLLKNQIKMRKILVN